MGHEKNFLVFLNQNCGEKVFLFSGDEARICNSSLAIAYKDSLHKYLNNKAKRSLGKKR